MARSPHSLVVLAASVFITASCGSDAPKKSTPSVSAGGGADAGGEGGAMAPGDGGRTEGGAASSLGGASEAGADAGITTDGWLSGSRLRAVLDVAGAAKMFVNWHDVLLDIDCDFAPAADGVERCLPSTGAGYAVYRDAECKVPVALLQVGQPLPRYVAEPSGPFVCGKGDGYFELGDSVTGVTKTYSAVSGGCLESGSVGATQIVKKLGVGVPASRFVAASKRIQEPRGTRLAANVRVAEDGSRQVTSHFDLERKADCNPGEQLGDGFACVPEDRAYIEVFFEDALCGVPAAYHPGYAQQVCGREATIIQEASSALAAGYYEVGSKITTPVFRSEGTAPDRCKLYEELGDPNAVYYSVGKPVPWSAFPQLSFRNEGTGRIAITVLRDGEHELIARDAFFDTELGVKCGVGEAADLKLRCIPRGQYSGGLFSDPQCSVAVYEIQAGTPLPPDLEYLVDSAPGGGSAVFKIGAKTVAPAKGYQNNGVACHERGLDPGVDYYATSAVAPADFALVTSVVE